LTTKAGITNDQSETLSAQEAWLDGPANGVASVDPPPGTAVAPDNSQTVTVAINPTVIPTPSTDVERLADYLAEHDTATVDDSNKYTIARQCLADGDAAEAADSGGVNAEAECREIPIFITGGFLKQAADHDLAATGTPPPGYISQASPQPTDPGWELLHYWGPKRPNKRGTTTYPPCNENPAGLNPPLPPRGNVAGTSQCDEYPFFSTIENADAGGAVNYQFIDAWQNRVQGGYLGGFYRAGQYGGQDGCNVAPGEEYLAIPIRWLPVKALYVCNPK
jgi:hypothetical protein